MKILKGNNGFTIIETLVAINLMFIAITFIFSFFLFAQKFTGTLSRNYTDKYIIQSLFSKIDFTLRKSDQFTVSFNNGFIHIVTNNGDSIIISKESINLSNYISVPVQENIIVRLDMFSNDRVIFENGIIADMLTSLGGNVINSIKIRSIDIKLDINGRRYQYEVITPAFSVKSFTNLER